MIYSTLKAGCHTLVALALLAFVSCTKENFADNSESAETGELTEVTFSMKTASIQVVGMPMNSNGSASGDVTRTVDEPTKLESRVDNIWVFQFDSSGKPIAAPAYYTVEMTDAGPAAVSLMLHACRQSKVFVVANVNDQDWGNGKDALTLDALQKVALEFDSEAAVYGGGEEFYNLPMVALETVDIEAGISNDLTITLKSLLAKVHFWYESLEPALQITEVRLFNIPSRVMLGDALGTTTASGPSDIPVMKSGAYQGILVPVAKKTYTWYIPQNQQGVVEDNAEPKLKNNYAPANAFYISMYVDSSADGGSYVYTVYPGGNTWNDFNVRSGYYYKVNVTFRSVATDDRVMAAPANCFVMRTGSSIVFDPYTRTEQGGGWDYSKYVKKGDEALGIDHVDILWQTGDGKNFAIGKNTGTSRLVYIENDKVHVTAGNAEGNAVIAGYNKAGDIVWSWHIWVNNSSPAQLSKAVPYTTYAWDETGIHTEKPRVKGKSVMSCNLGALADEPGDDPQKTYGLWYQWGRKDPFPGAKVSRKGGLFEYTGDFIIAVYDRSGNLISMTSTTGEGELFQTLLTNSERGTIKYVIQNPTHFLCTYMDRNGSDVINQGDWFWNHEDCLWGGKSFKDATKVYVINEELEQKLSNNGAVEKSIFDPCPAGWMVAPGDMWLGFTVDGLNTPSDGPMYDDYINCVESSDEETNANCGYHMYMDGAKWNNQRVDTLRTAFFPCPGFRSYGNAVAYNVSICGTYHTSTAGLNGVVNVFHMHNPNSIKIFESGNTLYRQVGANVRCVRERE